MKARRFCAIIASLAFLFTYAPAQVGADTATKTFYHIKGVTGYSDPSCNRNTFQKISANLVLSDKYAGVTDKGSQGALVLPDSSEIDFGEDTCVALSEFNAVGQNDVTLQRGAMKFRVVHPKGSRTNYVFRTPTSQVGVRGTVGLLSTGPQGDTVACIKCEPGDVEVTIVKSGQKIPLLTGQALTISIAGVVAAVTTAAVLAGTAGAGAGSAAGSAGTFASVPGAASAGSAVGATVAGAAAAGAISAGAIAAAAGVVAVGAAVVNNTTATNAPPAPVGTPTGVPFIFQDVAKRVLAKPTPSPSPSPSPKSGGR